MERKRTSQPLNGMVIWPSDVRRWLQAPIPNGVGSSPIAVTLILNLIADAAGKHGDEENGEDGDNSDEGVTATTGITAIATIGGSAQLCSLCCPLEMPPAPLTTRMSLFASRDLCRLLVW